MTRDSKDNLKFEIGHVLFIDIVGYSKLLINEQSEQLQTLKEIVRDSEQVRLAEAEGKLLRLPTGDGGALVFRNNLEAPVLCALEISQALKSYPELRVRMGIHSGPVNEVTDLNERANAAGVGINLAQRVMDRGDAGHILLSKRVADDLEQYPRWRLHLHDLGECEVKHGQKISIVNLYNDQVGNPETPETFRLVRAEIAPATSDASTRQDEGFWVAVLPFKYVGANADLTALAEGLSEEIVTGLSRFSYLRVIARGSTLHLAKDAGDTRAIGKQLGARYVMEGSLRQAGTKLRLAVQVVDTNSGAHLWAENYERAFSPETVFELQDDLVPRIVSTVADAHGVLTRSMSQVLRSRAPEQLSPYEAVLRSFGYFERVTPGELAIAREGLELAVQKAPAYADAWGMLALLCVQEHGQGFNLQADCLTSGLSAARRAVECAPANHLAHFGLAQALFFQKEFQSFRNAAERSVALNPMDGNSIALVGELLIYAGEQERGLALVERAKQLNPNHPGWYWYADSYNSYEQHDYRSAITFLLKADLPGHWGMHAGLAAAHAQLGENDAAGRSLRDLLNLRPDFAVTARKEAEKWWNPEYAEHFLEGLRKAGLEIANEGHTLPANVGKSAGKNVSQEAFWIAVLPFKSSGGVEIESFAHELGEEITTGLSRFPYLSVVARAAAARLKGRAGDERTLGAELGARYVVEGSIRKQGDAIRVSARLIDTQTGAQLWAETYDRDLQVSSIFAVQDDIAARIVATVADGYGVLVHSMREATRQKDEADFTPAEWQFQYFAYREQISPASHAALRSRLERVAKLENRPSDFWACLAQVLVDEYSFGFPGDDGTSLDQALTAARRGVELDRANQFAMVALAQTHFFRQDLAAFRPAAERAMALNPLNSDALGILGLEIVHTGEFERGTAIVRRAMELNPNHAGWMHFAPLWNHFHNGEYEQALGCANRVDVPGHFWPFLVMASACGHLGRRTEAAAAVRDLLALDPEFAAHARSNVGTWHFASGLMDPILEGLRKAGLSIPESGPSDSAKRAETVPRKVDRTKSARDAGAARADEGFWVAVLPFKYSGPNSDLSALAEGITEEIVTGLSRFSYLKVIARSSTSRYASESTDVRAAGKELGARYVMEGSLRQAGTKLRLAVQLVDAVSGAHLWAENYERAFSPETVFELQDDLVPRIVSTVADQYGALVHSMGESLRGRSVGEYSPHEAVLRAFGYQERMTPEEHAEVRDILEAAVAVAPDHSDCLAELASIYWHEYAFGYNPRPDPLGRARAAAERAVASAPTSHFAHCAYATGLFFQKDYLAFRAAAERTLALNRMDSATAAILGNMIAYAGDWEYGLGIAERAMQLNPHHAGWYHYVAFCDSYRRHDYRGALAIALKVNMPAYRWPHVYLAAVCGQLGEQERARAALRELHTLVPNFATTAREEMGKWLDPELTEHLLDGLRKAGLSIPEAATS